MADNFRISEQLATLFTKQPCWMIEPLAIELNYSIPSVRRFLSAQGYYSSFTDNGRWYTLRSIPGFNQDGLWFHLEIGFSRAGSLTKTLIALIANSRAGITAEQLGEKLHCRCHTVLVQLYRKKKLQRRKMATSDTMFWSTLGGPGFSGTAPSRKSVVNYIHVMCRSVTLKSVTLAISLSPILLSVISRQHRESVNQWHLPVDMSSIWMQLTMGRHRH